MSGLPPNLRARVLAEASRAPSPTIAERATSARIALALAVLAFAGCAYALGFAPKRASGILLALSLGGGASACAATWVAAARGRSMLGRPLPVLAAVAVAAPLGILAFASIMAGMDDGVVLVGGTARQHMGCLLISLFVAIGPFAALTYVRRGSDPVHPRALGAALGAAAGAWGAAMIDVHCSLTTIEHLALGHAFPVVLATVAGALVGARALSVRA